MKYKKIKLNRNIDIQNQYHLNSLLSKVLDAHQIDEKTIQSYLRPRLIYHDFSLFEEADITLDRIEEAIENQEKICIYGDYDCDGILATTILVQAFKERGINVGYHIPNRFEDGYGLNKERVKQIACKGYTLIITVDNGVKAFEAIDYANELGVDVIVSDHHQYDYDLPDALSFIHTKLSPDYPFKEISGGFVAYKLASALMNKQDKYLFSLAAITTLSDMMPLLDENRSLVKKAIEFMKEEKYPSIELLLGNQKNYNSTNLAFIVIPKINSFGRLPEYCSPNILVKYFLKDAPKDLLIKVATIATNINEKRKSLTNTQYEMIKKDLSKNYLYYSSSQLHEGLIGLIANKYTRQYEKPSFVMHYDEEKGIHKGSARSVEGFSLHDFFQKQSDLLLTFGGHALAGGFSVNQQNYSLFEKAIEEALEGFESTYESPVIPLDESDLTIDNIESLSLLEPFGMGNEEPLFLLENIKVKRILCLSEGKHLKIELDALKTNITGLYFSHGHEYEQLKNCQHLNMIGTLQINEYRNQKTINFIIKDIIENLY